MMSFLFVPNYRDRLVGRSQPAACAQFSAFSPFFCLLVKVGFSSLIHWSSVYMYILALTLIIDVGGSLGNVSASDFLNVTDRYLFIDVSTKGFTLAD